MTAKGLSREMPTQRILLAVTGLSPQIVTETLHALATDPVQPWLPDEIHLITTGQGAEQAQAVEPAG